MKEEIEVFELPEDLVDTRTREQKIGEFITHTRDRKTLSTKTSPNSQHRAIKDAARKLALDYCSEMILNLVEIAKTSSSDSARVDASKQILFIGMGRPGTTVITSEGGPIIPSFKIYFGDIIEEKEPDQIIEVSNG